MRLFGFINLDKPVGKTSHDMVAMVRKMLPRKTKVGHAGTLDPFATGVLVICVGQATRLADFVAATAKQYLAEFTFGAVSDTDDIDGTITETDSEMPSEAALLEALKRYGGEILQTPPSYSAVHISGRRAYELARSGEQVKIAPRRVRIDKIELLKYSHGKVKLLIDCGKGTYIRSIARDLGQQLGCGGYCSALRRTAVGFFTQESIVTADQIAPENIHLHLLPAADGLVNIPKVIVNESQLRDLSYGKSIEIESVPDAPKVAAVDSQGELAAICEAYNDRHILKPKVVFIAKN